MGTTTAAPSLLEQIACVGEIEPNVLERLRHEALTAPTEWVFEYKEFQSGGWQTVSLMNASGNPGDVTISDCDSVATALLDRMPVTKSYLASVGLRYMWVRLARLEPNSFLWEHRDYGELSGAERHRLHIPLVTNRSAALVTGGARTWLRSGRVWRLTPTHVHGACNLLGPDRLHLILDCYADARFHKFTHNEYLAPGDAAMLPQPMAVELHGHLARARTLIGLGYEKTAEKRLLRLFYEYDLAEGQGYDLISAAYESLGRDSDAQRWQENKSILLGLDH